MILAQSMRAMSTAGIPIWLVTLVCVGAAAVFAIGAWLAWGGRREPEGDPRTALGRWRAGLSLPSRAAVGLTLILMAYHGAAWVSPWQGRILMVPRELWWVVVGAAVVVVGLTLLTDRLENGRRE